MIFVFLLLQVVAPTGPVTAQTAQSAEIVEEMQSESLQLDPPIGDAAARFANCATAAAGFMPPALIGVLPGASVSDCVPLRRDALMERIGQLKKAKVPAEQREARAEADLKILEPRTVFPAPADGDAVPTLPQVPKDEPGNA